MWEPFRFLHQFAAGRSKGACDRAQGEHGSIQFNFDVVVVPDFTSGRSAMFEARCLFFLASWLEMASKPPGQAAPQLTLACIGDPPARVSRLAKIANAAITVHAPLSIGKGCSPNKLRGFEAPSQSPKMLLLDADVFVLQSLSEINALEQDIAASRADWARVLDPLWDEIYTGLGIEKPTGRIYPVYTSPAISPDNNYSGNGPGSMLPYYNSGVLLVRRDCGLAGLWRRHLEWIEANVQREDLPDSITASDQAGLITAINALVDGGQCTFAGLRDEFNFRPSHLGEGGNDIRAARLFHTIGFLKDLHDESELPDRFSTGLDRLIQPMRDSLAGDPGLLAARESWLRDYVDTLWTRWVEPLYRGAGHGIGSAQREAVV